MGSPASAGEAGLISKLMQSVGVVALACGLLAPGAFTVVVGVPNPEPVGGPGDGRVDEPGPAQGHPERNTWGYRQTGDSLDQPIWDVQVPPVGLVQVDMGGFNRLHFVDTNAHPEASHYWMRANVHVDFRMWNNGNGFYDPNPSCAFSPLQLAVSQLPLSFCPSDGDDKCPDGDFPLFDILVESPDNGAPVLVRTVFGANMQNCEPGPNTPEDAHPYEIAPNPAWPGDHDVPGPGPGDFLIWARIPRELLVSSPDLPPSPCGFRILFRPYDLELPSYHHDHDKLTDGVALTVDNVQVQLVAPPLVFSHGFDSGLDPAQPYSFAAVDWRLAFPANVRREMEDLFGQDPWAWAPVDLPGLPLDKYHRGIYFNTYDPKQDFRVSASELVGTLSDVLGQLGWARQGKVWLHGHSMGGLVSRYYIEQIQPNVQGPVSAPAVEKLAQDATPNLGSFLAHAAARLLSPRYNDKDGDLLGRHAIQAPCAAFRLLFFRPWWRDDVGVEGNPCFPLPTSQRDLAAEHLLKAYNPILNAMNEEFAATQTALPPYFVVRARLGILPGDGAVQLFSASMNDRLRHRTINSAHEETPAQMPAGQFIARFFAGVDLDTGIASLCSEPYVPTEIHPGDQPNPAASTHLDALPCTGSVSDDLATELPFPVSRQVRVDENVDGVTMEVEQVEAAPRIFVQLRNPAGVLVSTNDPGAPLYASESVVGLLRHVFTVPNPAPGLWRLVFPEQVPQWVAIRSSQEGLQLPVLRVGADVISPGLGPSTVRIWAGLTLDGAGQPGYEVGALVPGNNGFGNLALRDDGLSGDNAPSDGFYANFWTPPAAGEFDVRVTAMGDGGRVVRQCAAQAFVEEGVGPRAPLCPRPNAACRA